MYKYFGNNKYIFDADPIFISHITKQDMGYYKLPRPNPSDTRRTDFYIKLDINDFMTSDAGRFAVDAQFELVQKICKIRICILEARIFYAHEDSPKYKSIGITFFFGCFSINLIGFP